MNKTLGTTLLVSGTMIGAGMLAMPLTSAGIGFGFTLFLLISIWLILTYTALLFVEVYQTVEADAGIGTLSEKYFGTAGRIISTVVMLVFLFALLTAYISGGGGILGSYLEQVVGQLGSDAGQHKTISMVIFTVFFGSFVVAGANFVDGFNRFLFYTMLVALLFVLILMIPKIQLINLSAMPLNYALIISASPVFFTSFGFHGSIPSFNKYLGGDVKALKTAILAGTGITLIGYIIWQLATHGVLTQSDFTEILKNNPTLGGLTQAVQQLTGSTYIARTVDLFASLALITSFLGVALGLFDTLGDMLEKGLNFNANRLVLGILTFGIPLAFAIFYPSFLKALTYAGQMFVFYAVVLPAGLVWKARKEYPNLPYRVAGGDMMLWIAIILGMIIVNIPFLIEAGKLPPVIG